MDAIYGCYLMDVIVL